MNEHIRPIALVPMRHASQRVPGKNYRPLGGIPLYAHILATLEACPSLERIVVDTDSSIIKAGVQERFPAVHIIDRRQDLRESDTPTNLVLLHDAQIFEADWYLQTHCTNPFLRPKTVEAAIAAFRDTITQHDALFSVTRLQRRLWTGAGKPLNHDPSILLRTQDLPPLFEENSCLYIFKRQAFLETGNRLGRNPRMFEMEAMEAWDIDNEADFRVAEALLSRAT